jgi:NAD(P)-dependent dehydrogenase (short-subunit alcohol dehydrogenase family)
MATVLITGTSTGIGRATAIALARSGHTVVATMRQPDASPDLARLAAAERLSIDVLPLDVDDDASVASAVGRTLARHGHVDVLVNNAGVGGSGPVEEIPIANLRRTFETNVFGVVRCIQAVLPVMRARRSGTIVNVSSVAGRCAMAAHGAYAASKFALEALSEMLAQEIHAFGIRVAIIEPGVIETPIFGKSRVMSHSRLSAGPSPYAHYRRLRALFAASLQAAVQPDVVAEGIRAYIESDSRQLRHPVGPDAATFLAFRAGMSDEEWVALGGASDDEWCDRVGKAFGLDLRAHLLPSK